MDRKSFNRVLYSKYVPSTAYLSFDPLQIKKYINFKSWNIQREGGQLVKLKSDIQYSIYKRLCSGNFSNEVVGISSTHNDLIAQKVSILILYAAFNSLKGFDFEWLNTGYPKSKTEKPKIVIIYNVLPSHERSYAIRDLLDKYPRSLRLVIIGGITALQYFDTYLKYPISGMLHFDTVKQDISTKFIKVEGKDYPVFTDNISNLLKVL